MKMTVVDKIKIIDNKINANQAQYDLDRSAAKISAHSSGNLRKYEYLTGEDLGYKLSVVEQAKFDYSPLRKVFNEGLTEEDKKEGLLKSVKNIWDKNEELVKHLMQLIKLIRPLKMKVILIITPGMLFPGFTNTLKNLIEWYH